MFSLWVVLAVLSWLLAGVSGGDTAQLLADWGLLLLPPLAVWLTAIASSSLPRNRLARVAFWTVTAAGWSAAIVLTQGRYQSSQAEERQNLIVAVGLADLAVVWLAVKARSFPGRRILGEAAAGMAVLALVGGGLAWAYDARTRSIAAQAEARWTEIGRPMMEFEKTLAADQENDGSKVFRQVLRDQIGARFYREGTAAAALEPAIPPSPATDAIVARACEIIAAKVPPSDDFDLSPQPTAKRIKRTSRARSESPNPVPPAPPAPVVEPDAPALDADYRRLLAAAPPSWASDPHDGYDISAPNFLGIRKFSQLTAAESLRRFAAGDPEGAARAIAAGLRVGDSLRQNPTLVSLMIHVAVDATLAPQQVRLPATPDGLSSVARDAAIERTELLKRVQIESWACLRFADQINDEQRLIGVGSMPLPDWARRIANRHLIHREAALGALNGVEHAAIFQSPATLALPDLGLSLHQTVSAKYPSAMEANWVRAAMRIHTTLLLREQTELIRDARARLAAGRAVESHDSVILPGVRWELTANAEKNTVATRLVGVPACLVGTDFVSPAFWLLPLDGSAAWHFRPPARTASRL